MRSFARSGVAVAVAFVFIVASASAAVLGRAVDAFAAKREAIAEGITWQMGRPIRYTPGEVGGFEERARFMIGAAADALDDVRVAEKAGFTRFIRRAPLGLVFVIAPWNYPYLTSVNAVVPALMAGNAVILKHSTQTPLCAERYAEVFAEGLPDGLFQYLHLDHAVENLVDGAFFNSGQSCCGIERIYVHEDVAERFVDGFVALTKTYILGDPTDPATTIGPMVRTAAADLVRRQIADALSAGARALIPEGTPYLGPQVLVDVDHGMAVMRDESFGPVIGIISVSSDEEAVALINDSAFGLTASIWTSDADAALRIGDQVDTGTWFMNRCDYLDPALAWTGVKQSGRGCTLSVLGYDHLTRPKSFHLRTAL